ncbi:LysR family transcriptional regulator [Phyllobacterium sp. 0TCS1.6C]|uniref:LysR family transcriptional regulator n=1 Tax=unclassified Phyllobacterium TaxID=2638441 RepID=UPI0022648E9F|nr:MULTISPECIES: LysR family transcriptional regulator [unclassified Phyllobacterium]MCX8281071.1 LysR family transcriptional regulator [Phyllobacterium sp. 0TCS1.6C]MCX8294642.1 LysR family transcriptional regulator [Phyllobacterium sp. 0TCS1.6A]
MSHLNDMALFVKVARVRSFRKAAEALGMPNSTLSRRISELEKAIGLRLLHRTTRKIELTEAGQIYYERSKRIVDEARLAHEQLGAMLEQPSGVIRVSLPVDLATLYLTPIIADFARLYPGITFEFDLTPRRVDLVTEPFDVAIRIGKLEDSGLIARLIGRHSLYLYASPGYIEASGAPTEPADLRERECICMRRNLRWTLHRGTETVEIDVSGRFTLNSVGMIGALAVNHQGIALLPEKIVAQDLAAGRLRRILPDWQGPAVSIYAVTETRLIPAKTQRFIEFLSTKLMEA